MEKLIVTNFLNIKHIELDIGKINILIGPQAQGKSVVAKLVFFFQDFWENYRQSILKKLNKRDFDKSIIDDFKKIFPQYSWNRNYFKIIYDFDGYEIILENLKKNNNKNLYFHINYSQKLDKIRKKMISNISFEITEASFLDNVELQSIEDYLKSHINRLKLLENMLTIELKITRHQPIFIPTGRAFFANIQKNIFSLLSENVSIDYFINQFGSTYQKIKELYKNRNRLIKEYNKVIDEIVEKILVGNYLYEDEDDWIISKDYRKIKLFNASSGQQESVPMTIMLSIIPFTISNALFIIEEPEAHLFPSAQNDIVNLMSLIFNITDKRHSFFITTHSPYILTAFNILIQAGNTYNKIIVEKREHQLLELFKIVPENQMLDINDIKIYSLENGKIESIINDENKLIDANVIDEISNCTGEQFDKLLNLEFNND
ncbi:hypothetical protein C7H19_20660 [Aphanothece hegewaldii CCALA 016]|uniref:Endonuclease GajA/Old nuclease/RecF-like AAA domain-containing protein n=1 Tax=Aphanothece hegewaldii CCALA 016 TaxID=2107694 RepID=A0A2T1LST4_9CHRO|nr:AAA family ATPase [Aphanothece hegewaldii]PSF33108.1 hypothetical protein C7H19_20660 [Aphanothece hegewaldii CCALA 016]